MQWVICKIPHMQQTDRASKVDIVLDTNQNKVNKKIQMQSNASFVAPITLIIEPTVQPQARLILSVANKDILPLSVRKRISSQVSSQQGTLHQCHSTICRRWRISMWLSIWLMSLSLSMNVLELLAVTWTNPLSWYHSHFTQSTA